MQLLVELSKNLCKYGTIMFSFVERDSFDMLIMYTKWASARSYARVIKSIVMH